MPERLTHSDYAEAAKMLRCEISDVMAVAEVESRGDGFLADGRPKILFERHKFRKYSRGRFDDSHPHLSNKDAGGYKGGAAEWTRFAAAAQLDRWAAMMAISMGKFQVMGFNYQLAGFTTVEAFFQAMHISEGEHLKAFCHYLLNCHLDDELRENRWPQFAEGYNGKNYHVNQYDKKMALADQKYERQGVDDVIAEIPNTPQTDYASDASVALPPMPPIAETPAEVPQFSIETIKKQADNVSETVTTIQSVIGKASDTKKAFRTFLSMASFGAVITSIGTWFKENPVLSSLIFVGIFIVCAFAWKYMHRQQVIAVERTKNQ